MVCSLSAPGSEREETHNKTKSISEGVFFLKVKVIQREIISATRTVFLSIALF